MSQAPDPKTHKSGPKAHSIETVLQQWSRERPDLDMSAMAVIGDILQNAELLRRAVQDLWAEVDMDFPALDVILTLRRHGKDQAISPSTLAHAMMLSTSAMTNRIDRLEKRGFVRRLSNPKDRRSIQVQLTDDGFQLAEKMMVPHIQLQHDLVRGLWETGRHRLRALLGKLTPNV